MKKYMKEEMVCNQINQLIEYLNYITEGLKNKNGQFHSCEK